jgi:hypothetical protein
MSPTSGDLECLRPDELSVELRLAIFKKHGDHLFEVLSEFVDCRALGVRAWPSRYVSDIHASLGILLDDRREVPHGPEASIVVVRRLTRHCS